MSYTDKRLSYDEVSIVPEAMTNISHRDDCNCYLPCGSRRLPIFAAPMASVLSEDNWRKFSDNGINVVIPRSCSLDFRLDFAMDSLCPYDFAAFSLAEVIEYFIDDYDPNSKHTYNICIDVANGHMKDVIDVVRDLKSKYGERATVMAGNIANPKAYELYNNAGADYVRCGIGGGSACLTSSNTGVYYPYFSLLKEIYEEKEYLRGKCKIVADGNIRGYGDIQKALIYADFVMIGGLFNKAIESAGRTTYGKFYWTFGNRRIMRPLKTLFMYGREVKERNRERAAELMRTGHADIWKEHFGMSTKKAQRLINHDAERDDKQLRTAEGKIEKRKAEYTLHGWVENETDYLRSAMSYTNSRTLNDYQQSMWVPLSIKRYNE